ncbi:hypothetical protein BBO99_00009686 [Phytophthora kernoviae]|uniref:CBM1 domain-containing protein n=1 Tax=Phytophthora kernoviae TaxID=325452 RepID=A0A3R7JFJ9_9STRA|nr:hypothetical protein JM16_009529 [Phytophthora kernoviae]RLN45010.1 hypothetical protein BBI17_009648 [Phytophthora kernoviae]RLN72786.1 hypothetical protein BBO99_00009686 [Phytophthora kernoviae]
MKIFALTVSAIVALSSTEAVKQTTVHLRIHTESSCTITNESQCDGQNWSFSTCCADSSYECRWDDYGQNVKRCQKKHWANHKGHEKGGCTITNESQCNGQNWTGSTCCADSNYECRWSDDGQNVQRCQKKTISTTGTTGTTGTGTTGTTGTGTVGDWEPCTGGKTCKNAGSQCIKHSNYYSQCKPKTLPAGELCGQNDGTNVWKYDKCPSSQKCAPLGTDFRCTKKKHHHKEADDDSNDDLSDNDSNVKSADYAQCKPETLPPGELCGQNDGTNVWYYDHCTSGEACQPLGTDFRCKKTKKRRHHKQARV